MQLVFLLILFMQTLFFCAWSKKDVSSRFYLIGFHFVKWWSSPTCNLRGLTAFHLRSPYMGTCGFSPKRAKNNKELEMVKKEVRYGAILFDTFKDSEWVRAAQHDFAVIGDFYADFSRPWILHIWNICIHPNVVLKLWHDTFLVHRGVGEKSIVITTQVFWLEFHLAQNNHEISFCGETTHICAF